MLIIIIIMVDLCHCRVWQIFFVAEHTKLTRTRKCCLLCIFSKENQHHCKPCWVAFVALSNSSDACVSSYKQIAVLLASSKKFCTKSVREKFRIARILMYMFTSVTSNADCLQRCGFVDALQTTASATGNHGSSYSKAGRTGNRWRGHRQLQTADDIYRALAVGKRQQNCEQVWICHAL